MEPHTQLPASRQSNTKFQLTTNSKHFYFNQKVLVSWRLGQIQQICTGTSYRSGAYFPEVQGVQRTPCDITGTHVNYI